MSAPSLALQTSAGSRFCPYCGTVSGPEYAFCARCGKTLPSLAIPPTLPETVQQPIYAISPTSPEVGTQLDVGSTVWDRPLTGEERSHFEQVKRSPGVAVPRVLGSLFGIMPLFLVFTGLMGSAFPPESFIPVVIGTSVFAIIAGGVSFSFRMPASVALSAGSVREARGVSEKGKVVRSRFVTMRVGDADLLVPFTLAAMLPEGELTQILYVHGPGRGRAPAPGHQAVWLLGINGTLLKRSRSAYVRTSEDGASPGGV